MRGLKPALIALFLCQACSHRTAPGGAVVTESGPGSICVDAGQTCDPVTTACCSGVCSPAALTCSAPTMCGAVGDNCSAPTGCCTGNCPDGTCSAQLCHAVGQGCGVAGDCCSALCSGNTCQAVPAGASGATCATLGEVCGVAADCCSNNCKGGLCVRAYSCQADGDICFSSPDCCGNACSATGDGQPGRCVTVTGSGGGGCTQDGNPCAGGSNCCSRICVDLGAGATVCQPAGGCRLTGDYCLNDDQCCGGGINPNGKVHCSGSVTGRCDNGQDCNPEGNICGAPVLPGGGSINASQNCCDGKKEVCKVDSSGIPRCYGGGSATCPTGYDANNPDCCIAAGQACQFKDQCCSALPCVPNAAGGFVCSNDGASCLALGQGCTPGGSGTAACCDGTVCGDSGSGATICKTPDVTTCVKNGDACAGNSECCSSLCINNVCSVPAVCQPANGVCSGNGDCCAGLSCSVPPGQTSGTCQPDASCLATGQQCSVDQATGKSGCCQDLVCDNQGTFIPCDGTTTCTCVFIGS